MRQKTERHQGAAEHTIRDIRRRTRKRYSSEEKIRIVLAGLRGEDSIAELCRQEGMQFLWRWDGGTISTNLDGIWRMST